jgi:dCMP deaminase
MTDWNRRFLTLALHISTWSKDTSTKLGCVIVGQGNEILSTGYNGLPRGCNDAVPARNERPLKYRWYEHAERNAIYNAARNGIALLNSRIYLLSLACSDCARAIIQAGIAEIITTPPEYDNPRWGSELRIAAEMLHEAHIPITIVDMGKSVIDNPV